MSPKKETRIRVGQVYAWATGGHRIKIVDYDNPSPVNPKVTVLDLEGGFAVAAIFVNSLFFTALDTHGQPRRQGYILEEALRDVRASEDPATPREGFGFRWPVFNGPSREEKFLFRIAWEYIEARRSESATSRSDFIRKYMHSRKTTPMLTDRKLAKALDLILDSLGRTGNEILEVEGFQTTPPASHKEFLLRVAQGYIGARREGLVKSRSDFLLTYWNQPDGWPILTHRKLDQALDLPFDSSGRTGKGILEARGLWNDSQGMKIPEKNEYFSHIAREYIDARRENLVKSQSDFVTRFWRQPEGLPTLTPQKLSRALSSPFDASGLTGREVLESEGLWLKEYPKSETKKARGGPRKEIPKVKEKVETEDELLLRVAKMYIKARRENLVRSQSDFFWRYWKQPDTSPLLTMPKLSKALDLVIDDSGRTVREILEAEGLGKPRPW